MMKTIKTNRLFIFGGAYGNLEATKAILQKATQLEFENSEILFTGDSIAYCANPEETASLIQSAGIHAIKGNCEEAIANGADDCGCGFEEGTECDLLSDQWYRYCQTNISSESKSWMAQLPEQLEFSIGSFQMLAVHATPSSNNQFIFPSSLTHDIIKDIDNTYDGFITGHSGIPFIGKIETSAWLNSGAAGMPANDGTPRVWYATIDLHDDTLLFQTHALDYDHQQTALVMQENGLKNGYMDCLTTGIWPSHDVLPDLENSQTGIALNPQKKTQQAASFS